MEDIKDRQVLVEGRFRRGQVPVRSSYSSAASVNPNITRENIDDRRHHPEQGSGEKPPKKKRNFVSKTFFKTPLLFRVGVGVAILLILADVVFPLLDAKRNLDKYDISNYETRILSPPIEMYANKLSYNPNEQKYTYNAGFAPTSGEVAGQSYSPKVTAEFESGGRGVTINDPYNNVSLGLKPEFGLGAPQKNINRVVYPISKLNATKVFTLKATGFKEDIILREFQGKELKFTYQLELSDGTEARLESDGSLAVYGAEAALLGSVSTGNEQDAELLKKARENSDKKKLLFVVPKPVVVESNKKASAATVKYELKDNKLTVVASNLDKGNYPLSIDPSVYVESAAKLMRGNNETNTDFDVDNELIQKSQTTGARIDAWEGNLDMSEGTWGQGSAAAGGYVYRTGGETGLYTKPQIVDQTSTTQSSNSGSFVMNMPDTRQAGDLYVALLCHDGTGAITEPGGGGWTEYADSQQFAAYYKVGTDEGGGNEDPTYTWTGGSEQWYGVILRVTGFNTSDPVSGTPGTGNSGSDATPVLPATTPDSSATLVIRAAGADNDFPDDTGWIPPGHTKIDSGNSNPTTPADTNDCGFAAASLDTPPVSGVSTGTASLIGASLNDTYGAASLAINPSGSPSKPQIEGSQTTSSGGTDTSSFQMNMPSTRPAGDLYLALLCHDGTGSATPPSGWAAVSANDTDELEAYYKVGTDQGGGNEASSYNWTGISEEWAGVIVRVSGFDSSDIFSGTPGTTNTSGTPGTFPATTPDENNTLVIRAIGADNDDPTTGTAWVPSGHTKISSDTSSATTGDCGFVAASMDSSPAAGVSTGTVNMGNSWLNDDYGGITFAINSIPSSAPTPTVRASVNWAQFNSSTLEIESPNPGAGSCSDWCTDPTYDLPAGRKAHSMVAYNGYLYVMGGLDSSDNWVSTVYIAKLGANGEPSLWHPTDSDPDSWDYWYTDAGLSGGTGKSHFGAIAYNNRMYVIGGQTNASPGGITTVQMADILPNGILGSWTTTGMQALPAGAGTHMQGVQVYNDTLYTIGGFEGAATSSANLRNTVYYSKLNADGTMNAWQSTTSFADARSSFGGSYSYIWGAYIYLSGGCTAVNGSGYCTTIADDMQVISINSDGSLDTWSDMGIETERMGFNLIGWQGGLYRIGGCTQQDASTGDCISSLADVDYGVINPAGEVSTVNISEASGAGNCTGTAPKDCDLPPAGDSAGQGGQMLSATTILNGYLYVIGGCTNFGCSASSGNISYVAVGSDGSLQKPAICSGTSYGAWCVDATNRANGTAGISAAGIATFNNRIYLIGGIDDTADGVTSILYNSTNADGSLTGAWSSSTFASAGVSGELAYTYAYARANPTSAGSDPGNLYIMGGCGAISASAGCSSVYRNEVYKCDITTSGSVDTCSTSNQLQLDVELSDESNEGLGLHSGTVYANYIYLIGGFSAGVSDRDTVFYARFDDSNNIVDVDSGTVNTNADDWIESGETLSVGRRRGWAFGYNGHIYAVGGYDASPGSGIIPFIEWSKENVSDGSLDPFVTSSVTINQRWGLSMVVSNSYAYVIGGCDNGASPSDCDSFEPSIQTFQLYNNNSGTPSGYTAETDLFTTDRVGASSAILDGYIYVAGGCTTETCSSATNNVQFAPIDAYGNIGTWANTSDSTLPGSRGWGQLEVAGGTLYYVGGQSDATTEESSVYWGTPDPDDGDVASWATATNQLGAARSQFGATVWNDRIYVTGGVDSGGSSTTTVYVSPDLSAGGDIGSAWTTSTGFDVARNGHTAIAYANNLYILGGYDGTNYLLDVQFAQIASDGTIGTWTYTTSLPGPLRQSDGFAVNGYMYLVGGRSGDNTCESKTIVAPISANTTIASGNNPTGIGEWYETNAKYTGKRYGAAVSYANGKVYALGGGCNSFPSISSVTTEVFSSASGTHNVDMPATVASGDLLVVLFTNDGNPTVTDPDGGGAWTQIATQLRGTAVRGSVWAKVADGSEDATQVNFSTGGTSEEGAAQVYQIPSGEWSGSIAGVEAATFDPGGTTNAPNPASLNPGAWGTENTLWLAYAAGSSWTLTNTYPSGYQGGWHTISNTGTGGASASSAWLNSASASENPGAFGMSTTSDGVALTVGIRPAGFALTGNNRVVVTPLNTQPQVAMYSRLIDTDTDVFPNSWLLNGLDNSIGARWQTRYRSMNDTDGVATDCGTADMTTWGEETDFGDTTLGNVNTYVPLDGSGTDTECARYFYFFISIDASRTFGYPEDVNRGPTISDLSLFFTSDPSKRLRHGKTFTGGEQQPLDTPCRRGASSPGDPNYNCPLP